MIILLTKDCLFNVDMLCEDGTSSRRQPPSVRPKPQSRRLGDLGMPSIITPTQPAHRAVPQNPLMNELTERFQQLAARRQED